MGWRVKGNKERNIQPNKGTTRSNCDGDSFAVCDGLATCQYRLRPVSRAHEEGACERFGCVL